MSGLFVALILVLVELVALLALGLLFHDRLRPLLRRLTGYGPAAATPREFADQLVGANRRLRQLKGRIMLEGSDEKRLAACDRAFESLRNVSRGFARHPAASVEYGEAILHSCERLIDLLEDQVSAAEAFAAMQKATVVRETENTETESRNEGEMTEKTRYEPMDGETPGPDISDDSEVENPAEATTQIEEAELKSQNISEKNM